MFLKIITATLAFIGFTNLLMLAGEFMPPSFFENLNYQWVLTITFGVALLAAIGFGIYWHRQERRGTYYRSGLRYAYLQGFIRYWLAFEIAVYGFAKILKTQFQTPDYRLDMPLGEMSGFGLTWYYFGYSYILAVIIASFQIGGAVLLLYRRTTLLATIILLPVMVNIVFINIFYDIDFGAFINSILFTLGLTYLLLLDTPKLKVSFWDLVEKLPAVHLRPFWAKHLLRLMPIAAAFGLICSYVYNDKSDKKLIGTWEVQRYFRNGKAVDTHSWITDTTVVARVYFAGRYGCAFSPNPYAYKWQQALRGEYEYNDTKHQLKFRYSTADSDKQDSLLATISNLTARSMVVEGILRKDTIRMELTKLERKRP